MGDKIDGDQGVFARIKRSRIGRILSWPFRQLANLFRKMFAKKKQTHPQDPVITLEPVIPPEPVIQSTKPLSSKATEMVAETPVVTPKLLTITSPDPQKTQPSNPVEQETQLPVEAVTSLELPLKKPEQPLKKPEPPVLPEPTILPAAPPPPPLADRPEEAQKILTDPILRNFLMRTTVYKLETETGDDLKKTLAFVKEEEQQLEAAQAVLREVSALDSAQQKLLHTEVTTLENKLNNLESMTEQRRKEIAACREKISKALVSAKKDHEAFKEKQAIHENAFNVRLKLFEVVNVFKQGQKSAMLQQLNEAQKGWDTSGDRLTVGARVKMLDALTAELTSKQTAELNRYGAQVKLIELDKMMESMETDLRDFYTMSPSERMTRLDSKAESLSRLVNEIKEKFNISLEPKGTTPAP